MGKRPPCIVFVSIVFAFVRICPRRPEHRERTLRQCILPHWNLTTPGSPRAARFLVTEVSLILLPVIAIVTDAPYRLNIVQVAYRLPDSRRKVKGALYYFVFKERVGVKYAPHSYKGKNLTFYNRKFKISACFFILAHIFLMRLLTAC